MSEKLNKMLHNNEFAEFSPLSPTEERQHVKLKGKLKSTCCIVVM